MARFITALTSVLLVAFSFQVSAAVSIEAICLAQGTDGVGGNDYGNFVSDSRLRVQVRSNPVGGAEAVVEGVIMVTSAFEELKSPSELNPDNAYIGLFAPELRVANPDYKPRKYKGYYQFKNVDAKETAGQESGMWGEFVIAPEVFSMKEFKAAYIFKAGDHMGGTLLFDCKVK